jgi:hypothetical protein
MEPFIKIAHETGNLYLPDVGYNCRRENDQRIGPVGL